MRALHPSCGRCHAWTCQGSAHHAFGAERSGQACADAQHWFDRLAVPGIGECLVDLVELVELEDPVERELAVSIQLEQLRDEQLRHCVALYNATQRRTA